MTKQLIVAMNWLEEELLRATHQLKNQNGSNQNISDHNTNFGLEKNCRRFALLNIYILPFKKFVILRFNKTQHFKTINYHHEICQVKKIINHKSKIGKIVKITNFSTIHFSNYLSVIAYLCTKNQNWTLLQNLENRWQLT